MHYSQIKLQVNAFLLSSKQSTIIYKTHPYYFTFNLGVLKFQLNLRKQSRKACCCCNNNQHQHLPRFKVN